MGISVVLNFETWLHGTSARSGGFESQRNFLAIASSAPPMPPAVGFQLPPPSSTLVHHFCCVFARRNLHLFCLCGCCLIAVLSLRGDTRGLYMLGTKPDLGVWVDVFTMQALHSELAEHLRSLNGRHCKRLGSNSRTGGSRKFGSCGVAKHVTVEASFQHCTVNHTS